MSFNSHRRKRVTNKIIHFILPFICVYNHFMVLFLHMDSSSSLMSSVWTIPFSISCRVRSTSNKFSQLLLMWKCLNLLCFARLEFWVTIFSSQNFQFVIPLLSGLQVFFFFLMRNQPLISLGFPCVRWIVSSWCFHVSLSDFAFKFDYNVSQCEALCIYPACTYWVFGCVN